MRLHQVRTLATALLAGAFAFGLLGGYVCTAEVWIYTFCALAVVCIVGYWAVLIKFWRCPKCGEMLPVKQYFYSVKHCPQCGEELDLNRW